MNTLNRLVTSTLVATSILMALPCSVAERGPSTPEEREKAVSLVDHLEADPLAKDAKEARSWLTMWLIEVPDISVKVCGTFLGPVLESKKNYSSELVTQMMFSSARFAIRNPDKASDDFAVYTAGVEGSLRAYEAILKSKPKARWPFLDDLLKKRDEGKLGEYVAEAMKQCK